MSASEYVLHNIFKNIIADYHPFAEYKGYTEGKDGFIIFYQGENGRQHLVVDIQGNVVSDSTVGTTRILGVLAVVVAFVSGLVGGGEENY
jgi:hypothetical protein